MCVGQLLYESRHAERVCQGGCERVLKTSTTGLEIQRQLTTADRPLTANNKYLQALVCFLSGLRLQKLLIGPSNLLEVIGHDVTSMFGALDLFDVKKTCSPF